MSFFINLSETCIRCQCSNISVFELNGWSFLKKKAAGPFRLGAGLLRTVTFVNICTLQIVFGAMKTPCMWALLPIYTKAAFTRMFCWPLDSNVVTAVRELPIGHDMHYFFLFTFAQFIWWATGWSLTTWNNSCRGNIEMNIGASYTFIDSCSVGDKIKLSQIVMWGLLL